MSILNPRLPDLPSIAFWTGTSAATSVLLIGFANLKNVRLLDWKEYALWGVLGAIIGTKYSFTKNCLL
jgi:hypothetical protein